MDIVIKGESLEHKKKIRKILKRTEWRYFNNLKRLIQESNAVLTLTFDADMWICSQNLCFNDNKKDKNKLYYDNQFNKINHCMKYFYLEWGAFGYEGFLSQKKSMQQKQRNKLYNETIHLLPSGAVPMLKSYDLQSDRLESAQSNRLEYAEWKKTMEAMCSGTSMKVIYF